MQACATTALRRGATQVQVAGWYTNCSTGKTEERVGAATQLTNTMSGSGAEAVLHARCSIMARAVCLTEGYGPQSVHGTSCCQCLEKCCAA